MVLATYRVTHVTASSGGSTDRGGQTDLSHMFGSLLGPSAGSLPCVLASKITQVSYIVLFKRARAGIARPLEAWHQK